MGFSFCSVRAGRDGAWGRAIPVVPGGAWTLALRVSTSLNVARNAAITPDFFAVSSVRKDRIWYNRCNRVVGYMNCILINYPRAEKLQWDGIVTRISLTLAR